MISFSLDGREVEVPDDGSSLLDALREHLGVRGAKDGCSPQGQCGCCTVLVDGQPRVACVTPARRIRGRAITTIDGLPEAEQARWSQAFLDSGASQCGFCTPGIILRLQALESDAPRPKVEQALLAHLCRCTGWQTIAEAFDAAAASTAAPTDGQGREEERSAGRDLAVASQRATIEGRAPQRVERDVALGRGGFAEDLAPRDALVAVPSAVEPGTWAVGETLAEARLLAGKVQGRRTTIDAEPPLDVPPGDWVRTLRTSWVEPGYLEPDASWCEPGGLPFTTLANGGAFGGKVVDGAPAVAKRLAEEHGRAVRVVYAREDVVRLRPKRPPLAAGIRADGTGIVRVVRTDGIADAIRSVAPGVEVEEVDVAGPPTSRLLRAAGWAEAAVLLASVSPEASVPNEPLTVTSPEDGATASALVDVATGAVRVSVRCGQILDDVVLRSYCIGAAHMALGWVRSEGLAVDAEGEVHDLTIRSFGILRAKDMPAVEVELIDEPGVDPVNGSDVVFAAVAAAAWRATGFVQDWPTEQGANR